MMERKRVLVVGGSGYVGQHLLQGLLTLESKPYDLAFTYHTPINEISPLAFRVDLETGFGLSDISDAFGQPHVIVNCAALSVPRDCEMDPSAAMGVNVPHYLVKWLSSFSETPLLIHLSSDQGSKSNSSIGQFSHDVSSFYEGVKSFYKEEDETVPVNVYGKSKVEAEQYISMNCLNYVILRSSIIYGPQTVSPVPKYLPIQSIDSVLSKKTKVDFFHDEFRCPVYVKDVVSIILTLITKCFSEGRHMQLLLNVGGPDRVSRVQMAEAVASVRGYNSSLINPISASSVNRAVKTPADISMDISRLIQVLDITPTSFIDGVRLTLASS